jgi:hypothetical protein
VSYGVTQDRSGNGILALLCMTEHRQMPDQQDVTADLLPEGARAGFLISKERYMQHMLLPGLALMFDDPGEAGKVWPDDYFQITGNGSRITNTAPLGIEQFEVNEKIYEAQLPAKGFRADLEDNWLTVSFDRFQHPYWKGWYDVYHDIRLDTRLGLSEDRTQLILLAGSGEMDDKGNELNPPTHFATVEKTDLARGVEWTILIADVLLLMVSVGSLLKSSTAVVASEAGDKALKGAAQVTFKVMSPAATEGGYALARAGTPVVYGAINGVTKAQSMGMRVLSGLYYAAIAGLSGLSALALLENVNQEIINSGDDPKETIPDVGIFANMVMAPITWPGSSGFELTSAQFNGGVQMGGNPVFVD